MMETRFCDEQSSKENNSKSIKSRVISIVYCIVLEQK